MAALSDQQKRKILDSILEDENRIVISKALDHAAYADRYNQMRSSNFLDPYQQKLIMDKLTKYVDVQIKLWGGYEDAERKVAYFYPDFLSPDELTSEISVLLIKGHDFKKLSHRDFLGSLLGLGIKRELIGDILNHDDLCYVFCISDMAAYIKDNMIKVANVHVQIDIKDIGDITIPERKCKLINTTVASLRLDAILSAGLGESRSKVLPYITAEKVSVNWETAKSASQNLKEKDVISVRGFGRMVLEQVGGITKKGRNGIVIKRYI